MKHQVALLYALSAVLVTASWAHADESPPPPAAQPAILNTPPEKPLSESLHPEIPAYSSKICRDIVPPRPTFFRPAYSVKLDYIFPSLMWHRGSSDNSESRNTSSTSARASSGATDSTNTPQPAAATKRDTIPAAAPE